MVPSGSNDISERQCSTDVECINKYIEIDGVKSLVSTFVNPEGEGSGNKEKNIELIKDGILIQFYSGFSGVHQDKGIEELANQELYIDRISQSFRFISHN